MTTYSSSSSSSPPRTWKYNVFTSFHGQDVRKKFLSHLCKQFSYNGITMFDDQGIERGHTITPALIEAIRESRISIVLLSKNYASSSWCLDELLEILKCKEDEGQILMPVFYEVDPSNVRRQTGDFGIVFNKTCACKTEEEQRKWSESLTYVGNIAGEDFKNWDNEANMIEWIARYVSDKLNATPSRDFHGIVGLDGHLKEMKSLLELDYDGVKIVGISGPAGIGKTTTARALHSTLSNSFQHTCFMNKINGSYNHGLDEYGLQLYLQEQLLSKVLNLKGIRVSHLGVIKDRLQYHKVLITLDDVERLDQLEALADIRWFGPGSRVIVTTENKEILQLHGINDIYHVCFPSRSEALRIFCLSAFKQTFPPNGFVDLVDEVTSICGELPLGLHIFGSSLRGKSPTDWIDRLPRLKNCLDGRIESVLKVGYESLDEEDQDLFLLIAVFFNYEHVNSVTCILSNTDVLDVRLGLKNLANRYLIHICSESRVEMHRLLQVMAKRVISKQKVSKRKILDHAQDICYVLENAKGNGSVLGLSLDVAEINKLKINKKAFKGMYNLHILKVYNGRHCRKKQLHVPEEMEFPPSIRLLHWEAYPGKSLLRFWPENLVKLYMKDSQLEKLWEGTQPLANLKEMNLRGSSHIKELPDLSYATNLEKLDLHHCTTLVKLPSSVANLHKIGNLRMSYCRSLEVIPTLANLTSLTSIMMEGCSRLRRFPNISTNVTHLMITQTLVEEWPGSLRHCSRLKHVALTGSRNLKTFSIHLPTSVRYLYLDYSCIERIQDCIKWLHNLEEFKLSCCKRLLSLPKLLGSLKHLRAENCVSLESVSDPLNTPNAELNFTSCFKLSQQARRAIIQQTFVNGWAILPGREVPAEFDHRARGYYLTFPHSGFNRFKVCVVISSFDGFSVRNPALLCFCSVIGSKHSVCKNFDLNNDCKFQTEHLFIFDISLSFIVPSEVTSKIVLRFKTVDKGFNIIDWGSLIECGVKILTDETDRRNNGGFGDEDDLSYTLEFSEEEDDVDSITNERFESDSDNEDHKEGYTYESGETSKDKDEGSVDDGDYI